MGKEETGSMTERIRKITLDIVNRPTYCKKCKGVMVYKGLGEYQCEDCEETEYDDYGKVRNYLESHRGANVAEIASATDVSQKSIRDMIKEKRFEVIENKGGYLRCEMCGVNIKSGRLCPQCEVLFHRKLEAEARADRKSGITGGSSFERGESGSKRFTRER